MKIKYSRGWLILGAMLAGAFSLVMYIIAVAVSRQLCFEGCDNTARLIELLSPLGVVYLIGMFLICAITVGAVAQSAKPRGNRYQRAARVPLVFYLSLGVRIPLLGGLPLWALAACMFAIPLVGRELALLDLSLMVASTVIGAMAGVLVCSLRRVGLPRVAVEHLPSPTI